MLPGQESVSPTDPLFFGRGKLEGAAPGPTGHRLGDGLAGCPARVPLAPAYPVVSVPDRK